ncbi:hypothetical protein ACFUOZ_13535 [Paenarthrobacter sp. NPDC057355]|uniref:hypothetical protein n=1 Tax=Paenarthrobacter sp. NPDC057355 TaxID=3346105 RepID=UPI0036354A01
MGEDHMAVLRVCDEQLPGAGASAAQELSGLPDVITVEELIRWRVREEVARHNALAGSRTTVVAVSATERELNARGAQRTVKGPGPGSWENQADAAIKGFERNAFVVLVDDRQLCSLSDQIDVSKATEATFIKLVPLVGG